MRELSPAALAKIGFVLFVPLEILRLLAGFEFSMWQQGVVWAGQGLVVGAALWYIIIGVPNVRVIYAVCGLMLLMAVMWPWYSLLRVEVVNITKTAIERGLTPDDYLGNVTNLDSISEYTLLNLINAPGATFAAASHGCYVEFEQGPAKVIVNTMSPAVRNTLWLATIAGTLIAGVGGAVGAYNLYKLAFTASDKLWVIVTVAGVVALAVLLFLNSDTWGLQDGCTAMPAARDRFRVQFWTKVLVNPFGPVLMVLAVVLVLWWPRHFRQRMKRHAAFRLTMKVRESE